MFTLVYVMAMRFKGVLEDVLSSKAKIRLLKVLLKHPGKKFSGRELARLSGLSPRGAWLILELFKDYGIVELSRIGGTNAWSVNQESFVAKELAKFIDFDAKALKKLEESVVNALEKCKGVKKIVLYGSVAKSTEKPISDVDLFVLVDSDKSKKQVLGLINDFNYRKALLFGNCVSPLVYSEKELSRKSNLKIVQEIERYGKTLFFR